MAMSKSLKTKITAVAASGAFAITVVLLGGKTGLEGRQYTAYHDVAGVLNSTILSAPSSLLI